MRFKNLVLAAATTLCMWLATGCSTPKNVTYFQDTDQINTMDIAKPLEIRVRPEDKLSIVVNSKDPQLAALFNLPVLSNRIGYTNNSNMLGGNSQQMSVYTVDSEGMIDFPVLGKIYVEGKNRREVADYVKEELIKRDLIKDPTVTVEFDNMYVSVLGEVAKPGRYNINRDKVTVFDVLGQAGDLTIFGDRERVLVMRDENGKQHVYKLNLLNAQDVYASPAYYLQQNDMIYVEPNDNRIRQSTVNGNNLRSTSFWISLGSLLTSVAVLITNIVK